MYREGIPELEIFIVKGADGVPDDGRYHLVIKGELHSSFGSERRAREAYREARDRLIDETGYKKHASLPSPAEILRAEVEARAAADSAREGRRRAVKRKIYKGSSRTFG